jgi:hypothetical protein
VDLHHVAGRELSRAHPPQGRRRRLCTAT